MAKKTTNSIISVNIKEGNFHASTIVVLGVALILIFALSVLLLSLNPPTPKTNGTTTDEIIVTNRAVNESKVVSFSNEQLIVDDREGMRAVYGISDELHISIFDKDSDPEFRTGTKEDVKAGALVNLIINKDNDVTSITVISS